VATPPIAPVTLAWSVEAPVTLDWTDEGGAVAPTGDASGLDFEFDENSQYQPGL